MEIRRIRADEGPKLREVRLRALQDAPHAFASSYAREVEQPESKWAARAGESEVGGPRVTFVADDGERFVGLVACLPEADGNMQLVSMWVDPAFRGHGIGRGLADVVVEWARSGGARAVTLWVTETTLLPSGSTRAAGSAGPKSVNRCRRIRH